MISLDEARSVLLDGVIPVAAERVPLADALGRVLAADVVAAADQPAQRLSAMDGFAVVAADARAGARLVQVGQSYAGAPFAGRVAAGQAVRIATGAVVPDGADQIVMQEIVRRDGDELLIEVAPGNSRFIRPPGGDYRAGDVLLAAGQVVGAAGLGLVASAGVATVAVRRRPRVAILASGDELRPPGVPLAPGETVDSAGFVLAALVEQWGADPDRRDVLPDDHERALEQVEAAGDADLLLFIGGASVGDRDVLRAVVGDLGGRVLFNRIAVQPGKPSWHARFDDGRLVLGLPGNPASAFVCAYLLLEPLLAALLGRPSRVGLRPARLAADLPAAGTREIYWRGRWSIDPGGQALVVPDRRGDSSLQRPLAAANALVRQPPGVALAAGEVVMIIALGDPDS